MAKGFMPHLQCRKSGPKQAAVLSVRTWSERKTTAPANDAE
jgi:hypothetical protein